MRIGSCEQIVRTRANQTEQPGHTISEALHQNQVGNFLGADLRNLVPQGKTRRGGDEKEF